jgi:hypothetical protein
MRNRIHCSTPGKLNDPWDCQPWYDSDGLKDPTIRAQYADWLNEMGDGPPTLARRQTLEAFLRDPENLTQSMEELSRKVQAETARRRIYCLTPHPDSILMWSHYSNNHAGICLEFQTANRLFSGAMRVSYLSHYPTFLPHEMGMDQASSFANKVGRMVLRRGVSPSRHSQGLPWSSDATRFGLDHSPPRSAHGSNSRLPGRSREDRAVF